MKTYEQAILKILIGEGYVEDHMAELDHMQHHFNGIKKAKEDLSYNPSTKSEAIKTIKKTLKTN